MSDVKVRDSALKAINRCLEASKKDVLSMDLELVQGYQQLLAEQWARFCQAQEKVEISCGPESVEFEDATRVQAETIFLTSKSNLERFAKVFGASTVSNRDTPGRSPCRSNVIQLPKLQLPSFSGDAADWISFHDAFQSLVHANANLSDGQKLHYQRSCLKGDALQLVSGLKISDANYNEAWHLLISRYKVMRVIVDSHLKSIFTLEKTTKDTAGAIKSIVGTITQHVAGLRALGRPVEFCDDFLVYLTVSKLSFETRKQWELSLVSDDLPSFEHLQEFLETRARSLEMLPTVPVASFAQKTITKTSSKSTNSLHTVEQKLPVSTARQAFKCLYCNGDHKIYICQKFSNLDATQRLVAIKQSGACANCLSKGHPEGKCRSFSRCRSCQQPHHTLLHDAVSHLESPASPANIYNAANNATSASTALQNVANDATSASTALQNTADSNANTASLHTAYPTEEASAPMVKGASLPTGSQVSSLRTDAQGTILLATAAVFIQDHAARWQPARALFDNGSHASFITEACVQRLRLPRKQSHVLVTGIGTSQGGKVKGEVTLVLSPRSLSTRFQIKTLILQKITSDMPSVKVHTSPWSHVQDLTLADPCYATPAAIDILIGMDEMDKFLLSGLRKGPPGSPMALNTTLGWVLLGNVAAPQGPRNTISTLHCNVDLTRAVSLFWALEDPPAKRHLTEEELLCEKNFENTHQRASDGRFIVRLPFKSCKTLGESKSVAVSNLLRLEKRLSTNNDLRKRYNEFMQELLQMGHMEKVKSPSETDNNFYYMPHHAVVKETSTTTKLRVVFNASMKTSNGYSLNDNLMVGPQLQEDIFSILLRFRTHRFAMTADVEKMYRQVCIAPEDVDYQRIVWRFSNKEPIDDYRMLRVTYGVASASHLAVKCMQQTAKDASDIVTRVITQDFYMDDLRTGTSSIKDLKALQINVSSVLTCGGFELRKWASNCKQLIGNIQHVSRETSHLLADDNEVRTLGIIWNTEDDFLTIAVNLKPLPNFLTKKLFLSDTSTLFDPLGLISPCTIKSKIWMQQLWLVNVDWDDVVPEKTAKEWLNHRNDLPQLSSLKLNRWVGTGQSASSTEFHLFTDASERAYAAVLYSRTIINGTITTILFAARTKVAPLKSTTLPRLELCAASLGAKLVRQVEASLPNKYKIYAWTDSTVTLAWLQGHPSRWSTFVANRVSDVQEVLPPHCWGHVRSEHNPADCASRGVSPAQLLEHQLWWHGPAWLQGGEAFWHRAPEEQHSTKLELRNMKVLVNVAHAEDYWPLLTKYSSYRKLQRVTAYLRRFIGNLKAKKKMTNAFLRSGPITISELNEAEIVLVKYEQNYAFPKEISNCRYRKPISMRSSLLRHHLFLDDNELLRVRGRIKAAELPFDQKHQLILPKKSALAKAIIADIHAYTLHGGPQIMQTMLHRRFWVPGARSLVRQMYRSCAKCARINSRPIQQATADLPRSRLTSARCFLHTAVDFGGPYALKFSHGRGGKSTKGYICSFVCMSTGAMHLELVGSLSTCDFIAAFKRLTNRRGFCQHIYSDNATNFTGADRELLAMFERCMTDESVRSYFESSRITWHFNPPGAPHMGGYWETGIKRVKYHLKRALGEVLLTYEEFYTLLTDVEACVNSRPLIVQSPHSEDYDILTPGHFIVGEPLKTIPEPDVEDFRGTLSHRWQLLSQMRSHFWRRWRYEYLVSLQKRVKWFRPKPNLVIDDVVVIHDARVPPTKWKLGRIIQCHSGADDLVHVVRLKTSEGELLRPVAKLSLLPTKDVYFD